MWYERHLKEVAPRALTADGSQYGLVQVDTICGFFAKQEVVIKSNTQPPIKLEIKRFVSLTSFYVGPIGPKIDQRADISAYLVADGATISAPFQPRPGITLDHIDRASYEEEPVLAKRVIAVDCKGQHYSTDNPFPVQLSNGSINIGTVNAELEVQLSHQDNVPNVGDVHDSVRIGDGQDLLGIESDGSINVNVQNTPAANSGLFYAYAEALAVPAAVETTIITVPGAPIQKRIQKIEVSGTNVAEISIKLNGNVIEKKRLWHMNFNETFNFEQFSNGLKILAGDTVTVTVFHLRPSIGNFNATVWYL